MVAEAFAFAGDRNFDVRWAGWGGVGGKEQAELAWGALGAEMSRQVFAAGAGLADSKRQQAGGLVEVEGGAELAGGGAEESADERGVEGAEAVEFDGERALTGQGGAGSAAAADGSAGEQEAGKDAVDFLLPVRLFVAGDGGRVAELVGDLGVEGRELRQELVADAVAGVGQVGVGGVFAPGLADGVEPGDDLLPGGGEQGAEDEAGAWD